MLPTMCFQAVSQIGNVSIDDLRWTASTDAAVKAVTKLVLDDWKVQFDTAVETDDEREVPAKAAVASSGAHILLISAA